MRAKITGYIPSSITQVFEKLRKKGILTGIATGRNFYGIVPEAKVLSPNYYVFVNAAYVERSDGTLIYSQALEKIG